MASLETFLPAGNRAREIQGRAIPKVKGGDIGAFTLGLGEWNLGEMKIRPGYNVSDKPLF